MKVSETSHSPLARFVDSSGFQNFIIGIILLAAVVIGLETYPSVVKSAGAVLHALDKVILAVFTIEIVLKFAALGKRWPRFFVDGWNVFDLFVVVLCLVPIDAEFVAVFRLARLLRVLRLVTALPRLQLIVGALLKSVPSIGYVGILLALHFYVFSVLSTSLFGKNDPFHFGNLQSSILSLFEVVTMEGWVDLMKIQTLGCDKYGYDDSIRALCTAPETHPVGAPIFFVIFIVFGTMIILNLFIGVIMKGMEEMQEETAAAADAKRDDVQVEIEHEVARLAGELANLHARMRRSNIADAAKSAS